MTTPELDQLQNIFKDLQSENQTLLEQIKIESSDKEELRDLLEKHK